MPATLYVFSGLPGSGKTTLARHLAAVRGALLLRIDTLEQGLRDLCRFDPQGEGYRLAYRVASDNLALGLSVVADACNPIPLTRQEWRDVSRRAGARHVDIQVVCSDPAEHRARVESRSSDIPGLRLPDWEAVRGREYHPFPEPRILLDTAGLSVEAAQRRLMALLP